MCPSMTSAISPSIAPRADAIKRRMSPHSASPQVLADPARVDLSEGGGSWPGVVGSAGERGRPKCTGEMSAE